MTQKFKLVFIDDEEGILDLYETIVDKNAYDFQRFSNPLHAFDYINNYHHEIALIVSDFKMPELDGFELREKILEAGHDIPFVMVTGFYDKEMATRGMKLRICEFLEKPIVENLINDVIAKEATARIESINEEREMISEFLHETKPMLEEIEELILSLEEDPHDTKSINTYFRLLHTIKGTSSCLGLTDISGYAHHYEDLITSVQKNEIGVNRAVIDVLLKGLDQLKELYELSENFQALPTDLEERAKIFHQDFSNVSSAPASTENTGASEVASVKKEKSKEKEEKVTVPEKLLSEFLEMSGELTVIRNSIFKSLGKVQDKLSGDADVDHLHEGLVEMQKVSSVLQNQIAEMKKVSIETVYRPMRRVVRDSCSVLGKEVDFEIQGEALKIDTSVAKLLNGALVHLLRNGVDHGIESTEERVASGKEACGKLILNSYQTGEDIVVEIIDDGKGLDKEMLKRKAIEKGLYEEEELESMTDQKIFSIIFESGFSTNTEVTSVSGRGVGMDMVKSSIEEFGGRILIDSEIGRGSKFILIIPIPRSILIIKSLMVTAYHQRFNIPLDDVDEVVLYDSQKSEQSIYLNNGALILKHHNILCPLIDLRTTLGLPEKDRDPGQIDLQNIVIVRGEGFRYGIMVDLIEDIEEIVVKKLSNHFSIDEYLGTTFGDDGALSMIINCKGIANRYHIENMIEEDNMGFLQKAAVAKDYSEFMRFQLSKAPNCALPLELVYRLEEFDPKEIQFSGHNGLIRYRDASLTLLHVENLLGMSEETLEDIAKKENSLSVLVVSVEDKLYGAIIKELQDIAETTEKVEESFSDREGLKGTVTIDETIISVIDIESLIRLNRVNVGVKECRVNEEKSDAA